MKKTLLTCMAVLALFAFASSATAIVCTIDQRPAATLLVPYFTVAINSDGSLATGAGALDTLVTIINASSAPMIAHVNVFSERSELVLDFNIALTGFDVQAMSMGQVLQGNLPRTPISKTHVIPDPTVLSNDPCQRNGAAAVFPNAAGFLRIRPVATADASDNTLATTLYPTPAWTLGGSFYQGVIGSLDGTAGSRVCPGGTAPPYTSPLRGYITIDHANYCNLSSPNFASYYSADAIGNENNLMGEVIFVSGSGTQTQGISTVNIESSRLFSDSTNGSSGGGYFTQDNANRERTFYARYWSPSTESFVNAANAALFLTNPWNQGFGDEREPLGLKFATRYFEGNGVQSWFRVWRASSGTLTDLLGGSTACTATESTINLVFFDEDENTVSQPGNPPCPSPCIVPPPSTFNFPLETQRTRATTFTLPTAFSGANVGWLSASFVNVGSGSNNNGLLDQAWMDYEFIGTGVFINAGVAGTQLDPTTCQPLLLTGVIGTGTVTNLIVPVIPLGWVPGGADGKTPNPPAGTGP